QFALKTFQDNSSDVVLAACPFSFPPQRGFTLVNDTLKLVSPESIQLRSQDLEKNYHDAGAFYFLRTSTFKKTKNLWEGSINAIILQETKAQDIDNEEDWKMAELKYQLLMTSNNTDPVIEEWENKEYSCLKKQTQINDQFKLIPIRSKDRFDIMKWRNDQVYHLRQNGLLSLEQQNMYYQKTVSQLFEEKQPNQILFSFLQNDICIGYGGLVHINWIDKNAEISFIMDTALEPDNFDTNWLIFLSLIEQVAFNDLKFHKVFVYAFDLRPHLYTTLEKAGFSKEATLKEHCFYNGQFIDVIIHQKRTEL
ncbi:MAG: GNAT family N-acetyltransferase, partial [Crocinitomicaceae bacterium]|nr:GNAT family N-acetyltransferase [Crocinitomicaceae bacterium]